MFRFDKFLPWVLRGCRKLFFDTLLATGVFACVPVCNAQEPLAPAASTVEPAWNAQDPYVPNVTARSPYEPYAPPLAMVHQAPSTALWLGARGGADAMVGGAFHQDDGALRNERELVGPGPSLEVDIGGRFGRKFLPFLLFSHAFSAKGNATTIPPSTAAAVNIAPAPTTAASTSGLDAPVRSSSTNLLGFGFRYTFHPDDIGFVAEIAFAMRWTQTTWSDGTVLRAQAPGEFRIGLGADVRLLDLASLSALVVIAAGTYSDVTIERPGGHELNALREVATHAYMGLQAGIHFDLFGQY